MQGKNDNFGYPDTSTSFGKLDSYKNKESACKNFFFFKKNPDDPLIQEKLDATQETAYCLQKLMSQKQQNDALRETQNSQMNLVIAATSKPPHFRDLQRKQLAVTSKDQETELQAETEGLIDKMREQASSGNIPEYGQAIIDVLRNYQGNI